MKQLPVGMADDNESENTSEIAARIQLISYDMELYEKTLKQLDPNNEGTKLLIIGRTAKRRVIARKDTQPLKSFDCKERLPLSWHRIIVQESGEDEFTFKTEPPVQKDQQHIITRNDSRKKVLDTKAATLFLAALRLSQLMLSAHKVRAPKKADDNSEKIVLSKVLVDLLDVLENYLEDTSSKEELLSSYLELQGYVTGRLKELNKQLEEGGLSPKGIPGGEDKLIDGDWFNGASGDGESQQSFPDMSTTFENNYVFFKEDKDQIDPNDYLDKSPADEVSKIIKEVLYNALDSLFKLQLPQNLGEFVDGIQPTISLNGTIMDDSNPYEEIIELGERILPAIVNSIKDGEETQKEVRAILTAAKEKNTIRKLINNAPETMREALEHIIVSNNLESVMELELSQKISGVLIYERAQDPKPTVRGVYGRANDLIRGLKSIEAALSSAQKEMQKISTGKDAVTDVQDVLKPWGDIKEKLRKLIPKEQSIEETQKELDELQNELKDVQRLLASSSSLTATNQSILWIGLGQAGSQILRESLLYALDNMNDARCSALVSALGLRNQMKLNQMLLDKSGEGEKSQQAEKDLIEECNRNLHILAMNLGPEVDDLIRPSIPGYFLWGAKVEESPNAVVRRKRRNTIKLDLDKQSGAGGLTGIGRAFGYARQKEIEEALLDVGKKQGRTPEHIIITHSFAGGSGSGMILPVLQLLRQLFESDTMIWVISAGQGQSEKRESAAFNTPFILSDILQAHYDGIHSPMDPFNLENWVDSFSDLKYGYGQLQKELVPLETLIDGFAGSDSSDFMEYFKTSVFAKKSHAQERRALDRHKKIIKSIEDPEGATYWSKKDTSPLTSYIGEATHEHLLALLPDTGEETAAFNEWCITYNLHGRRPSVEFWNDWIDSIPDPLGERLSGIHKATKTTAGNDQEDTTRNFIPSLSSTHLKRMIETLKRTTFPEEMTEEDELLPELGDLEPLADLFSKQLDKLEEGERRDLFEQFKTVCQGYSVRLDEYNKFRRELTIKVQALSKSSNDIGIKNIVVSNAHLERGVEAAAIPVEDKTYTVFNAVVFDLIANIIGSQLPSKNYITGKNEYFDKQDLNNHTKPPMVVGLLEQSDSVSLDDTVHPIKESPAGTTEAQNFLTKILLERHVIAGTDNPFYSGSAAKATPLIPLFNSLFGVRMTYLLQHNPYELMQQKEPEKLEKLTAIVLEHWSNPESIVYGRSFDDRKSIKKNIGFSGRNMANMIRWLSTFEYDTLSSILGETYKIGEKNGGTLAGYCLPELPELDLEHSRQDLKISSFEALSGSVNRKGKLNEILPKLGIWTEEVLAAHSASFLNSYLVGPLLKAAFDHHNENKPEPGKLDELKNWEISNLLWQALDALHLNPTTTMDDHGESRGNPDFISLWKRINKVKPNAILSIKAVLDEYDLQLVYEKIEGIDRMTLRLHPRLHRWLNVIRDSIKDSSVSIQPSRSMSASMSRYISPDITNAVMGEFSAPLFTRALDLSNKNRYIGLLPDERFFNWAVFLRIILLGDIKDAKTFIDKLQFLAETNDIDIEQFQTEIEACLKHQYSKSNFTVYNHPLTICEQASILIKRVVSSKKLTALFGDKYPEFKDSTDEWLRIVKTRWGDEAVLNEEEFDPNSLRHMAHELQVELSRTSSSEEIEKDQTSELFQIDTRSEGVLEIQRLLFEILTNLTESLSQSIYFSGSKTERVRFQMTGFSDRIHGKPSGLLAQVHTDSSYRGNNDTSTKAIRESIFASIGDISDPKAFYTKSFFGPRASITTSFQQAPINEASKSFLQVMGHLGGHEPESYLDKTKLHPYVFLYNILWLSAKVNVWCKGDNNMFAKNFIIPRKVIEQHYSDPESLQSSAQSLATDSTFQGGIEVPSKDLRDFKNAQEFGETYRSMCRLAGLMALRHVYADEVEHRKLIGDGPKCILSESVFKFLEKDRILVKFAKSYGKSSLEYPEDSIELMSPAEIELGKILNGTSEEDGGKDSLLLLLEDEDEVEDEDGGEDTITTRTKAWLRAYKAWFDYSNPPEDLANLGEEVSPPVDSD